jgi:glycerophosphoryl diester phosphodiesterase
MSSWMIGVMLTAMVADRVEWIAHRGESADAPENTMAAFRLAFERRVAAIELDVHLSRDGKLVVCHDADTRRTSGVQKEIKHSVWEELRELDVGSWKDPRFSGERLPLLDDVLAELPPGMRCFIEIKVGPEAVPALIDSVRKAGLPAEQLVVISFQAATVAEVKRRLPQLKAYYLSGFQRDKETGAWTPQIPDLIDEARQLRADGLNLSHDGPLDAIFARQIRDAGLELYVWTVDELDAAQRMLDLGVDGITSNRAAWLRETTGR